MNNEEEYQALLKKYVGKTSNPNSGQGVYYILNDPLEIDYYGMQSLQRFRND